MEVLNFTIEEKKKIEDRFEKVHAAKQKLEEKLKRIEGEKNKMKEDKKKKME